MYWYYQGKTSPLACQKVPELFLFKESIRFKRPFADSSGLIPFLVKPVILENAANGIKILLSANKPSKADFDVYYKVADQEDDFDQIDWTEIDPEENVRSDDNPAVFRDYTYLVGGTKGFGTTFDKFIIKIVMKSTSSALVPTFKDLRVIALAV